MKLLIVCVTICALLVATGCVAAPPPAQKAAATALPPPATAVPPTAAPAPTVVPPTVAPAPAAQPDLIGLAHAFVAAMNRRDVEAAIAMFTDDAEYRAAHVGVGKAEVRTVLEYLDGTLVKLIQTDCVQEGQQVTCLAWGRDDPMVLHGVAGVRFKPYTYIFKDGKIQMIMGTADGPEWAAHSAASKESQTWMAANRAAEWKKITDEKGVLIRNGATAPVLVNLKRECAGEMAKQNPPAASDLVGQAYAFLSALNRRDVEAAMAMFTDDAEYRAGHVGVGKPQVRTVIEYLDGTGLRSVWSECAQTGQEVSCNLFGRDDAMAVYGTPGVRFNPYIFSFKDGKIQKITGTPDGPEWAANSAASKEATTWLAANRADEWKKITDEKGGLIRNAQTAPEIIRLIREYGKAKK